MEKYTEIKNYIIGTRGVQHWLSLSGTSIENLTNEGSCVPTDITFDIYIDPSGYVYDNNTGNRIEGAIVWLQRPDGVGGWDNVPTGELPAVMDPDINPQTTGVDGGYGWDVLAGTYRVHVEADGYLPAISSVVNIPPPVIDLNVGLTRILGQNEPPIANAGPDQIVELTSPAGAEVTLDGSASFDPDGDLLTYVWTWDGSSTSGVTTTVTMPMGITTVTLEVSDGQYTDTDTADIIVQDTTPPVVNVVSPTTDLAVQDGQILKASASDLSGVSDVYFYIREPDGGTGIPISYDDIVAAYNATTGYWEYSFDTTVLQDGYYVILAKAIDNAGNEGWSSVVPFSIRNWAVITLLPSTPNNKAGRTMPVKFSLRIAASVDPAMPFVYNEELTIKIYAASNPDDILQTSIFGTNSRDYRIENEFYITNFQTTKTPAIYVVEIWRTSKNFMVGSFTFQTSK
jgi:hypothetical protein